MHIHWYFFSKVQNKFWPWEGIEVLSATILKMVTVIYPPPPPAVTLPLENTSRKITSVENTPPPLPCKITLPGKYSVENTPSHGKYLQWKIRLSKFENFI